MPFKSFVASLSYRGSTAGSAVAVGFDRLQNQYVGKLGTAVARLFHVRFTKTKHARLGQEKIFPTSFWV